MLAGAGVVFSLVMVLVALAYRRRSVAPDDNRRERVWIVNLGVIFPAAVLAALLGYGLFVGERLLPRPVADSVSVSAQAQKSFWTFAYAEAPGRQTRDVLHIPAGRPVDVSVTTADVIHSFWVPRLAGKIDAIPGHVNVLRIEADRPGTYSGRSAEFSGVGYDQFAFTVVAHDPAGWRRFIQEGPP